MTYKAEYPGTGSKWYVYKYTKDGKKTGKPVSFPSEGTAKDYAERKNKPGSVNQMKSMRMI